MAVRCVGRRYQSETFSHFSVKLVFVFKVGYIANFSQKSFFRVYHYNLVHQKEHLSKNIC